MNFRSREEILAGLAEIRRIRKQGTIGAAIAVMFMVIPPLMSKSFAVKVLAWVTVVVGFIVLAVIAGRVNAWAIACPNCGKPFGSRGDDPSIPEPAVGYNAFTKRCVHCGIKVDGSNINEYVL